MVSDAGAVKGEEPGRAGLWEDFVDIFYAPSSVFARRADGKFGMPFLFLVVVGTVLFFLTKNATQPIMDAEFARQSAKMTAQNPNMTAEQLSQGRGFYEMFAPLFFTVGITVSIFGIGLVLWLVGKLFDAKESVAAAIMIATYSEVPRVVQLLTNAAADAAGRVSRVGKIPKQQAYIAAGITWLVGALPALLGALRGG